MEIWKDVSWTNGKYAVSNYASVKNKLTGKKLKPIRLKSGYYKVEFHFNGIKETWLLHRLVATVFKRALMKGEDAHHKNKMPCCNCINNIQIIQKSKHCSEHKKGKANFKLRGRKQSQQEKLKRSERRKQYLNQHPEVKQQMRLRSVGNQNRLGKKLSQQSIAKRTATRKQKKLLDKNYGNRWKDL